MKGNANMEKCVNIRRGRTSSASLQAVLDRYLAGLADRNYSPASIGKRRDGLRKLLLFLEGSGVERIQDTTPVHLAGYRHALAQDDYSPHSVNSYLRGMRLFFTWLAERGELFENPAEDFRIGRLPVRLGTVLTEDQVRKLLNAPDPDTVTGIRDRAMLEMLYSTGMRCGELVTLNVFDADPDGRTVRVFGKGRKERLLPLGRHASDSLASYLRNARPELVPPDRPDVTALWFSRLKTPLSKQSVLLSVARHAGAAGIPGAVDTHTLRRTCATHLLRNGAHPVAVADLLGHANLRSLSHYLKTTITDLMKTHAGTNPGR